MSVPTRGVFAEAVMGACNSCEMKDESRFWRWEESPNPDQPTPINPIQTTPPQRTDPGGGLDSTAFPTPMINIQNAPGAPDPGATVAGALGLLGKSDVFSNITGIEGTQSNAMQTVLANHESAKHYVDKAVEMAKLTTNQRGGNTTVDSIKKSMDDGTLDRDTGKKLIEDVYRAQITGKTSAEGTANSANGAELSESVAAAVNDGREMKASQTYSDGTKTEIDQKGDNSSGLDLQNASNVRQGRISAPTPQQSSDRFLLRQRKRSSSIPQISIHILQT